MPLDPLLTERLARLKSLRERWDELSPDQKQRVEAVSRQLQDELAQYIEGERQSEAAPLPPRTLGDFATRTALPSGGRYVSEFIEALTSPAQTLRGVKGLVTPSVERVESGEDPGPAGLRVSPSPEQAALAERLKERYGSLEALGTTAYEDPVGFLGDLSSLLGLGTGALKVGASVAPKIGGLGRAASVAGKAARLTDPLYLPAKGAMKVGRLVVGPPAKIGAAAIGAGTGAGTEAVIVATKSGKKFRDVMRGKVSVIEVAEDVRKAVGELRRKRAAAYQKALKEVKKVDTKIDLDPIKGSIDSELEKFRVNRVDGELDFNVSAITDTGQKEIARAVQLLENWPDKSVLGVDALKRRLADMRLNSNSGQVRAFIAPLERAVRKSLDTIPGYKKMTREYRIATEVIETIDREFSLSQKPGTTIRSLSNALNQNNEYRQILLKTLDEMGETQLVEEVAGLAFRSTAPRGIMRPLAAGTLVYGIGKGNLEALRGLTLTLPRFMGEVLYGISGVRRGLASVGRAIPGYPGAIAYRPLTIDLEPEEQLKQELANLMPAGPGP